MKSLLPICDVVVHGSWFLVLFSCTQSMTSGCILKVNMVNPGRSCDIKYTVEEIAEANVQVGLSQSIRVTHIETKPLLS